MPEKCWVALSLLPLFLSPSVFYSSFALHLFVYLKIALAFWICLLLSLATADTWRLWQMFDLNLKKNNEKKRKAFPALEQEVKREGGGGSTVCLSYGRDIRLREQLTALAKPHLFYVWEAGSLSLSLYISHSLSLSLNLLQVPAMQMGCAWP